MADRTVWTPDGSAWAWSQSSRLWECQCQHCATYPDDAQRETFADLIAAYEYLSDWSPSDAIDMAYEKQTSVRGAA